MILRIDTDQLVRAVRGHVPGESSPLLSAMAALEGTAVAESGGDAAQTSLAARRALAAVFEALDEAAEGLRWWSP